MAHPGAILTVSSYSAPTAPVSLAPGRDAFARPPGASFFTVFVKELKKTRTSCIIETEYAAKGMSVTEYGSGSSACETGVYARPAEDGATFAFFNWYVFVGAAVRFQK